MFKLPFWQGSIGLMGRVNPVTFLYKLKERSEQVRQHLVTSILSLRFNLGFQN